MKAIYLSKPENTNTSTVTDERGIHIHVNGYYHCTVANDRERQMIVDQIDAGLRLTRNEN